MTPFPKRPDWTDSRRKTVRGGRGNKPTSFEYNKKRITLSMGRSCGGAQRGLYLVRGVLYARPRSSAFGQTNISRVVKPNQPRRGGGPHNPRPVLLLSGNSSPRLQAPKWELSTGSRVRDETSGKQPALPVVEPPPQTLGLRHACQDPDGLCLGQPDARSAATAFELLYTTTQHRRQPTMMLPANRPTHQPNNQPTYSYYPGDPTSPKKQGSPHQFGVLETHIYLETHLALLAKLSSPSCNASILPPLALSSTVPPTKPGPESA
ncbi:hypothetical protein B0H67DRAFT_149262 [Lasiosphaeris hirsuta]|uniref:Uncharacterized protein n=1 Tax=Lasiosphaeris hirsuta TaxID=260670 RepID=A0AA40DWS1_9PEZI|nr:hypothetical protein B0H67DRAFT_149262 [Lasiosphaeris hirsuta]